MTCDIDCKRCRFYWENLKIRYTPGRNTGTDVHTFCLCEKNIDKKYPENDSRRFISTPSIINRYKNCNWFLLNDIENTYTWSAKNRPKYKDHGAGTFNINPVNGSDGVYIGEKSLTDIIKENSSEHSSEISEKVEAHEEAIKDITIIVEGHDEIIQENKQKIDKVQIEYEKQKTEIQKLTQKIDEKTIDETTFLCGGTSRLIK